MQPSSYRGNQLLFDTASRDEEDILEHNDYTTYSEHSEDDPSLRRNYTELTSHMQFCYSNLIFIFVFIIFHFSLKHFLKRFLISVAFS